MPGRSSPGSWFFGTTKVRRGGIFRFVLPRRTEVFCDSIFHRTPGNGWLEADRVACPQVRDARLAIRRPSSCYFRSRIDSNASANVLPISR